MTIGVPGNPEGDKPIVTPSAVAAGAAVGATVAAQVSSADIREAGLGKPSAAQEKHDAYQRAWDQFFEEHTTFWSVIKDFKKFWGLITEGNAVADAYEAEQYTTRFAHNI